MNANVYVLLTTLVACTACGGNDDAKPGTDVPETPGNPTKDDFAPGVTVRDADAVFKTEEYELAPGQEKYLCYATNLDEDLVVERISHAGAPSLHHVIFSKTTVAEPDGMSECDTLFRLTWEPVYLAGAGASSLDLPDGYAHRMPSGTQLLAQLHLLNSTDETIHDSVEITMRRSTVESPKPVSVFAFGNFNVNLPPAQPKSSLEGNCTVKEDIWLLDAFPHMHLLGTGMTFDVSHAGGAFERKFERTPFDFNDQKLDKMDLHLKAGDQTKVTCSYENTYDHSVTFGESTLNEMCFLVGIAADRDTIGGCIDGGGSSGN